MGDSFRYYLRVRYGECDAQKVVFNARYGDYVDLATTEFFRALGYGEELIDGRLDYQLVKQTLEWRAPARFDQVLEVQVRCARIGTTSFELAQEFRIAGSDTVTATANTVYVMVDASGKTAVPAALRTAMERGIAARIDHAGWLAAAG
ncbi:MAG: acyl-CoA thioesterase [Gammaproteobacteria bacterium]